MDSILDRVASARSAFEPQTIDEYFALQLARALDDLGQLGTYVALSHQYPQAVLADAYVRASSLAGGEESLAQRFQEELIGGGYRGVVKLSPVLGFRIERRAAAWVVLGSGRIEHFEERQWGSNGPKPEVSLARFVGMAIEQNSEVTCAVEDVEGEPETQRTQLVRHAESMLREASVPVAKIPRSSLLLAFGSPKCPTYDELHRVATSIWPIVSTAKLADTVAEAASLALHLHIGRQLPSNSPPLLGGRKTQQSNANPLQPAV